MATKTIPHALSIPKLGTARFSRTCPACDELIDAGDPLAYQGALLAWVHPSCFFDPRLKRSDDQLKDSFFAIVCSRREKVGEFTRQLDKKVR